MSTQPTPTNYPSFEVTFNCVDEDWLSWVVQARDFHDACKAAFDRVNMASINPQAKLYGARVLRVERLPDGYKGYNGVIT